MVLQLLTLDWVTLKDCLHFTKFKIKFTKRIINIFKRMDICFGFVQATQCLQSFHSFLNAVLLEMHMNKFLKNSVTIREDLNSIYSRRFILLHYIEFNSIRFLWWNPWWKKELEKNCHLQCWWVSLPILFIEAPFKQQFFPGFLNSLKNRHEVY